eukprot:scaffold5874_cov140-Isochrysis_galbana.AAC.1
MDAADGAFGLGVQFHGPRGLQLRGHLPQRRPLTPPPLSISQECGDYKRGACFRATCKFLHGGKPASEVQQPSVAGLNGAAGLPTPRAAGAFMAPDGLDTSLYDPNTGAPASASRASRAAAPRRFPRRQPPGRKAARPLTPALCSPPGFGLFGTSMWGLRYGSNLPLPKVDNVRPLCMDFYKQGFCNRRGPHNQGCLFRHDEIEGKGKIEQPVKDVPPEVVYFGLEAQGQLDGPGPAALPDLAKAAQAWAESRKEEMEAEEKVAADMRAAIDRATTAIAVVPPAAVAAAAERRLPAGWREATAPDGRLYYYNASTKATMWTRPEGDPAEAPPPLPAGWKEARAPDGRVYFYHAATKATSWKRPEDDTGGEAGGEAGAGE